MANLLRQPPTVFISYRRAPSTTLAHFLHESLERRGIDVYVDTRDLDAGYFTPKLLNAISRRDVFLCLLAESTLDSEWVKKEIAHAYHNDRLLLPVFQEGFTRPQAEADEATEALLQSNGIKIFERSGGNIDAEVNTLSQLILKSAPFRLSWRIPALLALLVAGLLLLLLRIPPSPPADATPSAPAVMATAHPVLLELNGFRQEFGYAQLEADVVLARVAENLLSVIGVPSASGIQSVSSLAASLGETAQVQGAILGLAGRPDMLTFDMLKLALEREGGEGEVHRLYTRFGFAQSAATGLWALVIASS